MAPITIPEGYVFVPRQSGVNVAAQLFDAVEETGADRYTSVLTVSGGYHVEQKVADAYAAAQPEVEDDDTEDSTGDNSGQTEDTGAGNGDTGTGNDDSTGQDGDAGAAGDDANKESEPLGVTVENTREEIDKYGADLNPPVDTTKAATKADAIKLLEDARKPATEGAE